MSLNPPQVTLGNGTRNAFDFFPTPSQVVEPSSEISKRLICGFVLGSQNNTSTIGTGCGLYPFLNRQRYGLGNIAGILERSNDVIEITTASNSIQNPVYMILSSNGLISVLNSVNNTVNAILYAMDPNSPNQSSVSFPSTLKGLFNFYNEYLFAGAYTGFANVDPNSNGNFDSTNGDFLGNGITEAFGLSPVTGEEISNLGGANDCYASRAGMELFALLNYLKYGGIAVVASCWEDLYKVKDSLQVPGDIANAIGFETFPKSIDCFVDLSGGSMLTGVNNRSNSTNDMMIYGGVSYAASSGIGLTYSITQGLTPEYLSNSFGGATFIGNVFASILAKSTLPQYYTIFHAGLSGTTFGIQQEFTDANGENLNLAFRHPSTDGIPFTYRRRTSSLNYNSNLGTTGGVLNDNQLNNLCCVSGKTWYKTFWTTTGDSTGTPVGGGPDGSYWVSCLDVIEFVGSLNRVCQNGNGLLFNTNIGSSNPIVFADVASTTVSSIRYPDRAEELLEILGAKRINTLAQNSPFYFPIDYVGATGSVNNPNTTSLLNRRYIQSIYGYAYTKALSIATTFSGSLNDATTRQQVTSSITDAYNSVNLNSFLRENFIVTCNGTNNPSNSSTVLNINISIKPNASIINTPVASNIASFNINITIS
jgi:hypothetical protein